MTSQRLFFRTLVTIEVLSEDAPPEFDDLSDVAYEITEGHHSGQVEYGPSEPVDGAAMARMLRAQGSDPEFFGLTDDGADTEE